MKLYRLIVTTFILLSFSTYLYVPEPADARSTKSTRKSRQSSRVKSSKKRSKRYRKHSKRRKKRYRSRRRRKKHRRYYGKRQLGIFVQSSDGTVVVDKHSDKNFNPASAIKLLTAYSAIKKFGPDHKFETELSFEGELETDTGIFHGKIYVEGSDPHFGRADAFALLKELSRLGIKEVKGSLVVSKNFSLYCSKSALYSGRGLVKIFRYGLPEKKVRIHGPVKIGTKSEIAATIATHKSEKLQDTLKVMLSRSLNSAAERIGSVVGGVPQLKKFATQDIGIPEKSIRITSASGLGQNRISPKHMMMVLRALSDELHKHNLELHNLMPVAGIDNGTLEKRFTKDLEKGSVVAKTGTLTHTDGGVSALVGVVRSKKEDLYFVHFGWHGGVYGLKKQEDGFIRQLQKDRGGPKPFKYRT